MKTSCTDPGIWWALSKCWQVESLEVGDFRMFQKCSVQSLRSEETKHQGYVWPFTGGIVPALSAGPRGIIMRLQAAVIQFRESVNQSRGTCGHGTLGKEVKYHMLLAPICDPRHSSTETRSSNTQEKNHGCGFALLWVKGLKSSKNQKIKSLTFTLAEVRDMPTASTGQAEFNL